jgi:hypothetical protein
VLGLTKRMFIDQAAVGIALLLLLLSQVDRLCC